MPSHPTRDSGASGRGPSEKKCSCSTLSFGRDLLTVRQREEATLKKSTGYDPYDRFAAALIAHAIKSARKVDQPVTHETRVSALRAIAWLATPGVVEQWFDLAGFEYQALVERLPLERWIERGHELLAEDAHLRRALS